MKLFEVSTSTFRSEIERLVAQDWAEDPFLPTASDDIYHLDDDEFDDLQSFVDDVVKFAIQNNITSPREAIDRVIDIISNKQRPTVH